MDLSQAAEPDADSSEQDNLPTYEFAIENVRESEGEILFSWKHVIDAAADIRVLELFLP